MSVTVLATNAQTQGYEITLQSGDEGMDGKITRLTTVWDGALLAQAEVQALTVLSIE